MAQVVRNVGTVRTATLPNGRVVERADRLQLSDGWYPVLNTDMHFIYLTTHFGSRMMCTCGMNGILAGFHAYSKYSSYIGNEVMMCHHYATTGHHADGSTG